MKILFIDFLLPDLIKDSGKTTGGASVRIHALSCGLAELGHKVGILTWKGANNYVGGKMPYTLVETFPPSGGLRFLRKIYYNLFCMFLATRKFKPDMMFAMGNSINVGIIAIISSLLNIPLGYFVTNDKDVDQRVRSDQSLICHMLFKFALRRTVLFICQNKYQERMLKKNYSNRKFYVMYNPILFLKQNLRVKPKAERSYIAWLGVYSYQKNFPALLEVCKSLPNISFKIAGSMPSNTVSNLNKKLDHESQVAMKQLEELPNVKLVGYVKRKDVINFLSDSFLLLNTSHYEGFSNAFLESFFAGTPVVTRNEIDPDNIIANNKLGYSVNQYSDLPSAITKIINSNRYDTIAQNCQDYVLQNHDFIKISTELAKQIESVLPKMSQYAKQ